MERGIVGEVFLDICVSICRALDLVSSVVDCPRDETLLVIDEIFLDGRAEEVEGGAVTNGRAAFAREVACEDLFLEAVESVGNALKVLEVGDRTGDGGVGGARGKDRARGRVPG